VILVTRHDENVAAALARRLDPEALGALRALGECAAAPVYLVGGVVLDVLL